VAAAILGRYAGSYDFRFPENPTVPSVWQIALTDGERSLQGAPLIPLSDAEFAWGGANRLTFVTDAQGRVTHFEVVFVEGNLVGRRLPDGR